MPSRGFICDSWYLCGHWPGAATVCGLVDPSAAFDTVDHSILHHSPLARYYCTLSLFNWFKSVLLNISLALVPSQMSQFFSLGLCALCFKNFTPLNLVCPITFLILNQFRFKFPFTTVLYTLTTACSTNIRFWLIFSMEKNKFKQKWPELKIKSNHCQDNSRSYIKYSKCLLVPTCLPNIIKIGAGSNKS